jgi:transposase
LKVLEAGSAPLIAAMCDEIKLAETINQMVTWDDKQCKLSPGTRIEAIIVNILSARKPLYKIEESYERQDPEVLFGKGVTADLLNDDALGRALDKLGNTTPDKVYLSLALSAMKVHDIGISSMHADTTSISLYGNDYAGEEEDLAITFGFSKAHRPDLKQFLYGLIVNQEGIPIYGSPEDGNMNDKTWNKELLEDFGKIKEMIPALEQDKPLYVADSALITQTNLDLLNKQHIPFVSRLPNNYGLIEELKTWAFAEGEWQEIGQLGKQKDAACYKIQGIDSVLYEQAYRFIVVHSSALDKKKAATIDRNLKKAQEEYEKACQELLKKDFYCEADATEAMQEFLKEHQNACFNLEAQVTKNEQAKRKRGRPAKNELVQTETFYHVDAKLSSLNEQEVARLKEMASSFVLISNAINENKSLSDTALLQEYKEQIRVENAFRFLKNPVYADGIYLKNPRRVTALGYVFLMALLIYSLLQRRVRQNIHKENRPLITPGKIKTMEPTANTVLEMLKPINILQVTTSGVIERVVADNQLDGNMLRLLKLTGFSDKIYVTVKERLACEIS